MVRSALQEICMRYAGQAPEYLVDPIPRRKLDNSRQSLEIPSGVSIVALVDFTVMGGAKESLAITDDGLYWKNGFQLKPAHLGWKAFAELEVSEERGVFGKHIRIGGAHKIDLTGANTVSKLDNQLLVRLLSDLKRERRDSRDPAPRGAHSSSTGLVRCEFCGERNKPDVTYCKHCGIKLRG